MVQFVNLKSWLDMIRDTINQLSKESFHQLFNVHIICTFFKKLSVKKLLQLLHWWLVTSQKPGSSICDIFGSFTMNSVNFPNGPALIFLTISSSCFQLKNSEISSQKCQSIGWCLGFLWNAWLCTFEQAKNYG